MEKTGQGSAEQSFQHRGRNTSSDYPSHCRRWLQGTTQNDGRHILRHSLYPPRRRCAQVLQGDIYSYSLSVTLESERFERMCITCITYGNHRLAHVTSHVGLELRSSMRPLVKFRRIVHGIDQSLFVSSTPCPDRRDSVELFT